MRLRRLLPGSIDQYGNIIGTNGEPVPPGFMAWIDPKRLGAAMAFGWYVPQDFRVHPDSNLIAVAR